MSCREAGSCTSHPCHSHPHYVILSGLHRCGNMTPSLLVSNEREELAGTQCHTLKLNPCKGYIVFWCIILQKYFMYLCSRSPANISKPLSSFFKYKHCSVGYIFHAFPLPANEIQTCEFRDIMCHSSSAWAEVTRAPWTLCSEITDCTLTTVGASPTVISAGQRGSAVIARILEPGPLSRTRQNTWRKQIMT